METDPAAASSPAEISTVTEVDSTADSGLAPPRLVPWGWRLLYIAAGLFFVGLAIIGILLPGIPATPFLLLASYFFVRSSPRLHRWLVRSPLFGTLLQDWQRHRGVRPRVKWWSIAIVLLAVAASLFFSWQALPLIVSATIVILAAVGIAVIARLPTVPRQE